MGGNEYKKVKKQQESETGIWFDKKLDKRHKRIYSYIKGKYKTLMKKCPLYNHLNNVNNQGLIKNAFTEFIKMNSSRDHFGRAQRIEKFNKIMSCNSASLTYNYLRLFFLKKMLLGNLARNNQTVEDKISLCYYKKDLEYCSIINPFIDYLSNEAPNPKEENLIEYNATITNSMIMSSDSSIILAPPPQFDEYRPKSNSILHK